MKAIAGIILTLFLATISTMTFGANALSLLKCEQVNIDGFGDSNNIATFPSAVFKGSLYVGTLNWVTGGEVWRTSDGTNWTQVNIDGFGDPNNTETYPAASFDGNLYVGTINEVTGGEIWRLSRTVSSVGGISVPVDKFGLLAPYIGLASTILVTTVATVIYVKRVKRRKEKQ